MRIRGAAFLLLLLMVVVGFPRPARADQPGAHTVPVAVLAFDSDDAEDQADAMTGAIRSRIRAAQGWSLIETTQSLGILTAAMKCPTRPTPDCQQKIAEQIKAERYIYGFVAKGPTNGQVTAEIHLYQKGKQDTVIKESYADNLKDSNDDTLRKIATRIVERLGGTAVGVVVVSAKDLSGDVVIDGEKHVPLSSGTARIELAAGGHSIEVTSPTGTPIKRNVLVTAGRETVVELTPPPVTEPPPSEATKSKTRKTVGGIMMGAGAALGVVGFIELAHWLSIQSQAKDAAGEVPSKPPVECRTVLEKCRQLDSSSVTSSTIGVIFGSAAAVAVGIGGYLFFFSNDAPTETKTGAAAPPKPTAHLVPTLGAGSGGLVMIGTF